MHVRVSARATKEESRCEVRPTLSPSKRLTTFRPAPRTARSVAGFLGEKTSEGARTRRREGARGRRLVLRTQWAPPVPRRVPRRSRNATRRDASENGGRRGGGSRQGGLCCGCATRGEAAATAREIRLRSSWHEPSRHVFPSVSFSLPLSFLSLAVCSIPSHVSVHLLFHLSLSSLLILS